MNDRATYEALLALEPRHWFSQTRRAEAFEKTLEGWLAMHSEASEEDGVVALAAAGVMAPISELSDVKARASARIYHDAHCQLRVDGEMWTVEKIRAIDNARQVVHLVRGWRDAPERVAYTVGTDSWAGYVEKAVAAMMTSG